jgi:cytochrome c peroxidase
MVGMYFACILSFALSAPSGAARSGLHSRWLMDWAEAGRRPWYTTPQGSFILPMDIFLALKTEKGDALFASRKNLSQYGWVYPPDEDTDKYTIHGLPLGFVEEANARMRNVETLGLTCAACHTGELVVNDTRYVVDGGQPLYDIVTYNQAMVKALAAAAHDDARLAEMHKTIVATNPASPYAASFAQMKEGLLAAYAYLDEREQRNRPAVAPGPGRLDAVTQILNELFVHIIGLSDKRPDGHYVNARDPAAPISLPYLWSVPELECVQTNCLARNSLSRNLGETLGVYGDIRLRGINKDGHVDRKDIEALMTVGDLFDTSAKLDNLYRLEASLEHLPVPKWPSELGAIDEKRRQHGSDIYFAKRYEVGGQKQSCASCHVIADTNQPSSLTDANGYGRRFFKVTRWAPALTETDSAFVDEHGNRTVVGLPPHLTLLYDAVAKANEPLFDRFLPKDDKSALKFLGLTTFVAVKKFFRANHFDKEKEGRYSGYHERSTELAVGVYKARPLNGIAFTAPYLHNGSVASLEELLKKPELRAKRFALGTLAWDANAVGYKTDDKQVFDYGKFVFDTQLKGNYNTGHVWGTELGEGDKKALIEFLKSL